MNPFKAIVGVVVSLVVIAALAVGGWQLGWWAQTSAVNHQAHIFANSYGTQSADIAEARNLATQITQVAVQINDPATPTSEVSALRSQQVAMTSQACSIVNNITPNLLPADLATFAAGNCH
jgi:hypothetical protein